MTTTVETPLLSLRTHPKVLVKPAFAQLLLIGLHILVARFFPADTGVAEINQWGPVVLHSIIALIELAYVLVPTLAWMNARFTVTDRRLEEHWGVLYKNAREIPLDRIASVTVERGILDRIFGCGTLIFYDSALTGGHVGGSSPLSQRSGGDTVGIRFTDVPHVLHVQQVIDQARFAATH